MSEQEEIQATLAEHRAWTWNRFKEEHGPHVIGQDRQDPSITHVYPAMRTGDRVAMCGNVHPERITFYYTLACWPTCKACAAEIYNLCTTSLPEVVSVQSEVSGVSGQLVLPDSENWGL
jgi:hypothetical protein